MRGKPLTSKSADFWNFKGVPASYLVHGLHPYPAKMHPHIVKALISKFSKANSRIVDPFCGSGTTLVEALLAGKDSCGLDLNPQAVIVSKAKTTVVDPKDIPSIVRESTKILRQ